MDDIGNGGDADSRGSTEMSPNRWAHGWSERQHLHGSPTILVWLLMAALCSGGCGGAPPIMPTTAGDSALLSEGDDGHFLPPARAFVPTPLRERLRATRRPAGPSHTRLVPRRSAVARRSSQARGAAQPRTAVPETQVPETQVNGKRAAPRANVGARAPQLAARQRVSAANALLGTAGLGRRAFVDHVLHAAGATVRVEPGRPYAAALWQTLAPRRVAHPRPGDVVFFRDTLDMNGNERPDDGVTWAAIVERVDAARVLFIGQRAGKVRRMSLSTQQPKLVRDANGRVRNTRLVRWPSESQPRTAGECWAGYARP